MSVPDDPSRLLQLSSIILRVENLEHSEAWYQSVFGFQVDYRDPSYRLVRFSGGITGSVALWERRPGESFQPLNRESAFLTFVAPDLYEAREALVARGADCTPLSTEPGTHFFWVSDPNGHQILVIQLLME
jgi:catechol 2,3-dioxygenase-like lactoylglutathione lyase family enzyme